MNKKERRVLLLGVDAGDPTLIRDWANAGQLPFFQELERNSAIFPVKNDVGFFVGSVWPSYATGKTPDQHHWYCYRQYDPGSYHDIPFDPSMLQAEPFWGELSRQGIRVGVIDVPLLPVASGIDGFQVSEWGSHDTFLGGLKTWPADLADDIREKFGPDPVGTCDDIARTPGGFTQFVASLEQRISTRERMIAALCKRYAPDFLFAVLSESHCAGHQAWHLHDAGHPRHDAELTQRIGDPLLRIYKAIDASARRIVDRWKNAHVLVLLSHGMGPHYGISYMLDAVLERLDHQPVSREKRIWGRAQSVWQATPDWIKRHLPPTQSIRAGLKDALMSRGRQRRRFFAVSNNDVYGAIRINLLGREPRGCVTQSEFPALIDWLKENLLALRCSETGEPVALEVVFTPDLYGGPFLEQMPDLLIRWNQSLPIESVSLPDGGQLRLAYRGARTGDHRGEGVGRLYYLGGSQAGAHDPARNIDIAPTVAALLNISIASLPGKVIGGIL